jgi:long-chain acyl-CoA synthetase
MSFWQLDHAQSPAMLYGHDDTSAGGISYAELADMADGILSALSPLPHKRLGVIRCRNAVAPIAAYLGALRAGDAVMLVSEQLATPLWMATLEAYQPDWVFEPDGADTVPDPGSHHACPAPDGWRMWQRKAPSPQASGIHPELAVLLSTSGTTGSAKMVRLSYRNIDANARAIAEYLGIDQEDRAITTLPFNYSYGLSVINSHLQAGAQLVLTESSLLSREFWDTFARHAVTSLAGVPYTFQMLHRLDPRRLNLGSLRTLTQAGGSLAARWLNYFRDLAHERGWRFVVMYGQTEASPRISYVPPEQLAVKSGSIGVAVPGGKLSLSDDGELIYEGPNVMMGYAMSRADLTRGDEMHGRLHTGDLARMDEDGFVFLLGRIKRFVKIHGNRVSLDDIEQRLEQSLGAPVAVTGDDERIRVYVTVPGSLEGARAILTTTYRLHATTFSVHAVDSIPMGSTGKKDYGSLTA